MALVFSGQTPPEFDENPQSARAELYWKLRQIRHQVIEGFGQEGTDPGDIPPGWQISDADPEYPDDVCLKRYGSVPGFRDALFLVHGTNDDGTPYIEVSSFQNSRTSDGLKGSTSAKHFAITSGGDVLPGATWEVTRYNSSIPSESGPLNMDSMSVIQNLSSFVQGTPAKN
jgi:hypothetical protein